MKFFNNKIGIDLGTVNSLVINQNKEILAAEPTVVAVSKDDKKVLAVGLEANKMVGKTPEDIEAIKPLFNGAIANYTLCEELLEYFINKALGRIRIIKPDVVISIPSGSTSVEYRAVLDAANNAGAKNAYLVPEPLAAALGSELPIFSPTGNMIVNSGGGTTEVAVVSLGGLVSKTSVRTAGNNIDDFIVNYVRKEYNMAIGSKTAEAIKIKIGSAVKVSDKKQKKVEVRGRDLASGMPKNITLSTNEVVDAIQVPIKDIIAGIKQVLENTSPELASDILDKGMVLSGGTALLRGLDDYITKQTGIPAVVAENPLYCVIQGIGEILENVKYFERSLVK